VTSSSRPHGGRIGALTPTPGRALATIPAAESGAALGRAVMRAVKAPHRPVLVVISGEQMGLRTVVEDSIYIGRSSDSGVVLTDPLVSGRHALLEDRGDGWALVDLGSTNGTTVNGDRGAEFVLAPGDKIVFGNTVVRFELRNELEQAYDDHVERLLTTDDLSGLYVRRKFDAELGRALDAAHAAQTPLGLLVMDLDGIKRINDNHGHLFGAYVIGESGRVVHRVIDGGGFATRFGGDEYIAALPGVALAGAAKTGQRILDAIAAHRFEREGIVLRPGISIGAAAFPESAADAQTLFQRADEALYRAKRAGKNQVCL
jgi:two-component system cell cycle response regulator